MCVQLCVPKLCSLTFGQSLQVPVLFVSDGTWLGLWQLSPWSHSSSSYKHFPILGQHVAEGTWWIVLRLAK